MSNETLEKSPQTSTTENTNIRDHLANERTFLAWIRTSLGLMAFGFVVEKFSLFLKQLVYFLRVPDLALKDISSSTLQEIVSPSLQGYSSTFGILLVAFGTLMGIFAYVKFARIEKQIKMNAYRPSLGLDLILALSVLLIGMFLVIYLTLNSSAFNK